jgi:hypothetical protein
MKYVTDQVWTRKQPAAAGTQCCQPFQQNTALFCINMSSSYMHSSHTRTTWRVLETCFIVLIVVFRFSPRNACEMFFRNVVNCYKFTLRYFVRTSSPLMFLQPLEHSDFFFSLPSSVHWSPPLWTNNFRVNVYLVVWEIPTALNLSLPILLRSSRF